VDRVEPNDPDVARTLPRRVLEVVRRERLWAPGDRVAVGVSGGLDSTVLIEVLARTVGAHGGRLEVVSVDHGLRAASAAEVVGVGRHAQALGLPFRAVTLDIAPGPDLASRCREARRAALAAGGGDRIATGHHQDDQAETVLHHLLRGAGLDGLQGMRIANGRWVRPLLTTPREMLRMFAHLEALQWVEDPSNAASLRGRMRALMPALDALHGGAGPALARSAGLLAQDAAFVDEQADAAWRRCAVHGGLDLARLRGEPPALQARALRRLILVHLSMVRADHIGAALRWIHRPQGRLGLPGGWGLVVRDGLLWVASAAQGRGDG
jgi:tRNA(Ile)-lysidine synthase